MGKRMVCCKWTGQWVDGWTHDGRAGNKTLVWQDPSSLLFQPSPPPLLFSQTLLGDKMTVTSDGGEAADPCGLQLSGSLTAHLAESQALLPFPILRSALTWCPGEERKNSATSCNHKEQTKQNTPSPLVPKIASLATQTRWLAGSPSFKPD